MEFQQFAGSLRGRKRWRHCAQRGSVLWRFWLEGGGGKKQAAFLTLTIKGHGCDNPSFWYLHRTVNLFLSPLVIIVPCHCLGSKTWQISLPVWSIHQSRQSIRLEKRSQEFDSAQAAAAQLAVLEFHIRLVQGRAGQYWTWAIAYLSWFTENCTREFRDL